MLAVEKVKSLIRKKKTLNLIKKKKLSQLTASLLLWQKQLPSPLVKTLEKPEKIVVIENPIK